MTYYNAKVQFEIELDNGKVKKQVRNYLVDAVSCTDAEASIHKFLASSTEPFEVTHISESKVVDVVTSA